MAGIVASLRLGAAPGLHQAQRKTQAGLRQNPANLVTVVRRGSTGVPHSCVPIPMSPEGTQEWGQGIAKSRLSPKPRGVTDRSANALPANSTAVLLSLTHPWAPGSGFNQCLPDVTGRLSVR